MANITSLIFRLQRLGLDEKEARVYIAALELGPSPVQKISQRAGVPRATTYLVLDALRERGLVTTFQQGKKTFYVVESPEQLERLVAERLAEANEQKSLLDGLVGELKSRGQFRATQERPIVRFYEGAEALKGFVRDIIRYAEGEILGIISYDSAEALLKKAGLSWEDVGKRRQRVGVQRRVIYTWQKKAPDPSRVAKNAVYVPYEQFPCSSDITIAGKRVGFVPYNEPIRAVVIEDAAISQNMRAIFDLLWERDKSKKS